MDNGKYDFLSDVSEFWFFNKEFRDAVNDEKNITAVDTRAKIQELLLGIVQAFDIKYPKQIFNKQKGEITVLPKSPVRKRVLEFLDSLVKKEGYSVVFANQPVQHKNHKVDYSLTEFERDKKFEAKEMYKKGRFQEAVEIALELLKHNSRLRCSPGIIGFIANCYNKLGDYENALYYAVKAIELEPGQELKNKGLIGVAALAAQKLELWDKALSYAEQLLELDKNVTVLGIATLAAYKSKRYAAAIEYGNLLLGIEPDDVFIQNIIGNAREMLSI